MANLTNDDLYMCKHSTVTTDKDGFTVPACTLCHEMACDVVLHYGDEGCKYEREEPHENDAFPWDEIDEYRARRHDR